MTAQGSEPVVLPSGLRERVMSASHQVRLPGKAVPEIVEDSPPEAFAHAADAFGQMLGSPLDQMTGTRLCSEIWTFRVSSAI